jgi:hypothetical protein
MHSVRITPRHVYILLWLLGLAIAVVYAAGIAIERSAPVNPVTGFHMSIAGSLLFFAYPVAVTIQAMLFLTGLWMLVWGMISDRRLIWGGFGVLGLGFMYAALNYVTSMI